MNPCEENKKENNIACLPVVRKKADREALKGYACSQVTCTSCLSKTHLYMYCQCDKWYEHLKECDVDVSTLQGETVCNHVSRHRRNCEIPKSPKGLWSIGFSNIE